MRRLFLHIALLLCIGLSWTACQEERVSTDPSLRLRFSADSVFFDTVFNQIGSSTRHIMVYNPNKSALRISNVTLQGTYFRINLDGENDLNRLHDIEIYGGDSLYLFIRVMVDEQTPVLAVDTIRFFVNGNEQDIALEAYGLQVHPIRTKEGKTEKEFITFRTDSSYLIYDTLVVNGATRIEAGATLYMHRNASLHLYGGLQAVGTQDNPIRILGDRTDQLFNKVPYRVASGQWGGIYLYQPKEAEQHIDSLNYVDILSGNVGLRCQSESPDNMAHLVLSNSRIHNHAMYGLVLENTDADIWNTEISNCASYCIYLDGGRQNLTHNTIASFFGWPNSNLNIHNVSREDVAAVYVNNLSKESAPTILTMRNCIVTGIRQNNIVVATPLPDYYEGSFTANYLRADSLPDAFRKDNVYASDSDTVFVNTHYKYKEYIYYDFRLDSVSPARKIGEPIGEGLPWSTDRQGLPRTGKRPDAGCYEWTSKTSHEP